MNVGDFMDKVVHFEIPTEDMKRAEKFYKENFGWGVNLVPQFNYAILHTGPTDENGMTKEPAFINGGMMKRNEQIKSPVITINVDNIDNALSKIEKSGGKTIMKKMKVGDMGYAAYFKDTEGNVLGLWQNVKK